MIRKYILFFVALTLFLGSCNNKQKQASGATDTVTRVALDNPEKIQQISEVITRFVRAYQSQDNGKANALIHPDHGIAIVYRPGAMDNFTVVDSLDFSKPVPESYPYTTFPNDKVLTFEALPEFQCDTDKWTKLGFFCDSTSTSKTNVLETIAKFQDEYNEVKFDDTMKAQISNLENGSFRVILNPAKEHFLIFHVKQFDGAWYVTLLDRSYGNCDA